MAINAAALSLIKRFEGLKTTAYYCAAHVPTIGFGHTATVKASDVGVKKITEAQAEKLLQDDLKRFEADVSRLVKVPINENQFGALVSFCYNIGTGAFASSTLLKLLNAGRTKEAAAQFERWNKGGGRILAGLTARRAAERMLFDTPIIAAPKSEKRPTASTKKAPR